MDEFLFKIPASKPKDKDANFRPRNPIWTECKAKLIERYLFYFVQVTFHGTYIDAFAGPQEPDKPDMWSARLVIESRPRWFRNFFLFDIDPAQVKRLKDMCASQAPRDKSIKEPVRKVEIYEGDFNTNILQMLKDHPIPDKEASFCVLDQRTFECDWRSVEAIARHKKAGNKIELFYFFPEGWINRSIHAKKIDKKNFLEKWWGNDRWEELLSIHGVERAQHVCNRVKSELGYKHVNPFAIYERKDQGGKIMYYMIHASDHDAAPSLMHRAYGKALDLEETDEQLEFLKQLSLSVRPRMN